MNRLFKYLVCFIILVGSWAALLNQRDWDNSIYNPVNAPYVLEVSFHEGICPSEITQAQFNDRYLR